MSLLVKKYSVFILIGMVLSSPLALAAEPTLIVLLAIDQLRPERITSKLPGGLGRLVREGLVFTDATLDHGLTSTCPGHVVMSTGVNPGRAGVPGNSFIDHGTLEERYCVDDPSDENVVLGATYNRSPNNILVSSLGEWMKAANNQSRVFSVSGKDRAAIAMAGKQADGVYWFDHDNNRFTTSGYYEKRLPEYIEAFNGRDFYIDGYGASMPAEWSHEPGKRRIDDYQGETEKWSRVSGHPLNMEPIAERGDRVYYSPYLDEATAALVKELIRTEAPGSRGVTDLLAMSFSATDTVGHLYGPFSAESEDTLRRLDENVGEILDLLDEQLDGNYVIALTADHGVMPLPEWLIEKGEMACPNSTGRVLIQKFGLQVYWQLYWAFTKPFGNPARLIEFSAAGLVINERYATELGTDVVNVARFLEEYLETLPEIAAVWTPSELQNSDNPVAQLYQNSYVEGRSGHIILQPKENCLFWGEEGTSHGTPYDYDRHIPLIFYGLGVRQGLSNRPVHSVDIAPTLAKVLAIDAPTGLDGTALVITTVEQGQ